MDVEMTLAVTERYYRERNISLREEIAGEAVLKKHRA